MYDVVLDWMLMDAFDDLSNPPSSVVSVVQNRWLSNGLKETAISTAVWSILKAKRRLLKVIILCPNYFQGWLVDGEFVSWFPYLMDLITLIT